MIEKYLKKDVYLQKERQEVIDELILKQYNNGISKHHKMSKTSETVTNKNDQKIPK